MRTVGRVLWVLVLGFQLACSSRSGLDSSASNEKDAIDAITLDADAVSTTANLGPVTATVSVGPKEPVIGDLMSLVLSVDVKDGVVLHMPGKAEAFTRFSVEKYQESREKTDIGERHIQKYVLQASASGRLRIPPLRIAFVDQRVSSKHPGEEQELLSEEIAIRVAPVLAGEQATTMEMRSVREKLNERPRPSLAARYGWALGAGVVGIGFLLWLFLSRRGRIAEELSPYEKASVALGNLEAKGLPDAEERDHWYVRLSGIVREYLEGRFALRAPELTTEEFLRVAQRSELLSNEHKALLSGFLADCDRVKFAGYEPDPQESLSVLAAARRFLLETRVADSTSGEDPTHTPVEEVA